MKYYYLLLLLIGQSCQQTPEKPDYSAVKNAFEVAISQPAGTTDDHTFLPYPANFGRFEDNEGVDVLVLAPQVTKGTRLVVRPLGVLRFKEAEQTQFVIIASPLDTTLQLTSTTNFRTFLSKNAGEKQIIQDWFLFQKGIGKRELIGWEDEAVAFSLVQRGE
ncbi:MAG: inorganic diphosphatase [Bacteroidota bacterium]